MTLPLSGSPAAAFVRLFGSGAFTGPPNEPNTEQHAASAFGAEPNTEPNTEQRTERGAR